MASMYSNAYIVVAATSSKTGDDGCFRVRSPSRDIAEYIASDYPSNVYVQREVCHRTICE